MTQAIDPWSPYLAADPIVSSGRRTLVSAFADLVFVQNQFQRYELPEIFEAPEDEGENDIAREMVRLDAVFLTQQFLLGKIATYARPMGGGDVVPIPAAHWEIDDPLMRMATGAYNREHWADPEAPPTHRIFVDGPAFDTLLASLKPLGPLTNKEIEALDPQARAARSVAARRLDASLATPQPAAADPGSPSLVRQQGAEGGLELLKLEEVENLVKLKRSSIYNKIRDEGFPAPITLGGASRWNKREVLLWIEEQAAKRGR